MGPGARESPIDNTQDTTGSMSQAELGNPERDSPISTHADIEPTARQEARSANIGDEITGSIKRRVIKPVKVEAGSGVTQVNKLNDTNWVNWHEDMIRMLTFLKVKDYLLGKIPRPDPNDDPEGAEAWDHNDSYALHLISLNLSESQKIHISWKITSNSAWNALLDIHEAQDHDTITSWMKSLFQTVAEEGSDILKHINKLLGWYERIILANDPEFPVTDSMFKSIITNSLPTSWHTFTTPYVRRRTGIPEIDWESHMPASKLIGIIKEEYDHQQLKSPAIANALKFKSKGFAKPTLQQRIGKPPLQQRMNFKPKWCNRCKCLTHNTEDCRNAGTNQYGYCGKYGHTTLLCRKRKFAEPSNQLPNKRFKQEVSNVGEEDAVEIVSTARDDMDVDLPINQTTFDTSDQGDEYINFDVPVSDMSTNDDRLIYYDWLADSATTSHVTNQRDAFINYEPLTNKLVLGVGNNETHVIGRGTIKLESNFNGQKFIIKLEDVLHIPDTRNSLISLGRWDRIANRATNIKNGILTLSTKDGIKVAKGKQVGNFLYRMDVQTREPCAPQFKNVTVTPQTFVANEPAQSWETWH